MDVSKIVPSATWEDIPQEIRDQILPDVVAVPQGTTILINDAYQFPVGLHLRSSSRAEVAETYFKTNTFIATDTNLLTAWLNALPPKYTGLLRKVRDATPRSRQTSTEVANIGRDWLARTWDTEIQKGVLWFKGTFVHPDGRVEAQWMKVWTGKPRD